MTAAGDPRLDEAQRQRTLQDIGFALALPPAAGIVGAPAYAYASPLVIWLLGNDIAASAAKGIGTSVGLYSLVAGGDATPAGYATATLGGLVGGTMTGFLNRSTSATVFSDVLNGATGAFYGLTTFNWMNLNGVTSSGTSWWTSPLWRSFPDSSQNQSK